LKLPRNRELAATHLMPGDVMRATTRIGQENTAVASALLMWPWPPAPKRVRAWS